MEQKKIDRINQLAQKSRKEPLTEEEKLEHKKLREEYIAAYRNSLKQALDHTVLVDEQGNRKPLRKR